MKNNISGQLTFIKCKIAKKFEKQYFNILAKNKSILYQDILWHTLKYNVKIIVLYMYMKIIQNHDKYQSHCTAVYNFFVK